MHLKLQSHVPGDNELNRDQAVSVTNLPYNWKEYYRLWIYIMVDDNMILNTIGREKAKPLLSLWTHKDNP